MAIISFGLNFKRYMKLLLGCLFKVVRACMFMNKNENYYHIFTELFLMGIGMSLSLVFEFISFKLRKSSIDEWKYHGQIRKKSNLLVIVIIGVVDSVCCYALSQSDLQGNGNYSTSFAKIDFQYIFQFFFVGFLSWYFLKHIFYRHHFFYSVLIIFAMIAKILIIYLLIGDKFDPFMLLVFIDSFFYGIIIIIQKWLFDYHFVSPYSAIGYMGIFSTITSILIFVFEVITESNTSVIIE